MGQEYRRKIRTLTQKRKEGDRERWEHLSTKYQEAMQRQDIGEMYSTLKHLGLEECAVPNSKRTLIPVETFEDHFQEIHEQRHENALADRMKARKLIRELATTSPQRNSADRLNVTPTNIAVG